jgi:redox-regulated HSP33 family molecular chaperone
MYDWATWRMYDRITSARNQASSLARALAGEADQTPARVFSRVDVNINKPQDQATTTPLAFQTIPSKSRTTINHRHARYTYEDTFAPSLVSDTTYEEDFVEESYHEGEVFTLDI